MSEKAVNIICGTLIGATTIYLLWHVCQAANAAPVAGATKAMQQAQLSARLNVTAGVSRTLTDELSEAVDSQETPRDTERHPSYIYSSSQTLNPRDGVFYGPSGKESYYNLPMGRVVEYMHDLGYDYEYWIRKDGAKMFGDYVMVAADLSIKPKGTVLNTSLGKAIVCDTGAFARKDSTALDVAVAW